MRAISMILVTATMLAAHPVRAQAPDRAATLEAMRKAADGMDAAADTKAYRKAWEDVIAYAATVYSPGDPRIAALENELAGADYFEGDIKGALARSEAIEPRLRAGGTLVATQLTDLLNSQVVYLMTLGRHGEARAIAADVLARRIAQHGGAAHVQVAAAYSNYANAEFEFGSYDEAIELIRQAIVEVRRLTPTPPNAAIYLSNLAVYLGHAGRLDEAIETAKSNQVEMEAMLPAGHPFLAANLNTLARYQLQLGSASEAEAAARRAVDLAHARFGEKMPTSIYMATLAQALIEGGKAAEGRAVGEAATRLLTADLGSEADRTLLARETVANALAATGDRAGALAIQTDIAAIRARKFPPHHRDRILGGDRMAAQALSLGAVTEARTAQVGAQALRTATMPADDIATLVGEARLGAIEVRGGDIAAGLARARAAAAGLDRRLQRLAAAGARRTGQDLEIRSGYGWVLDAAMSARDTPLAFAMAQRVTATSAGRAARDSAARAAATDPRVATAMRDRQDTAAELERLLDRQLRLAGRGGDPAATSAIEAERTALSARLAAQTAALGDKAVDLSPLVDLAQVQAGLDGDEALLVAAVGPVRTALFAVTGDGVTMAASDGGGDAVTTLVKRLRGGLGQPGSTFDFAASAALHATLFPTTIRAALAGKPRLLIAANGALAALPFAALAPADARPSLRSAHWLVRDHALVTLPSIAAATTRRAASRPRDTARFVAVGAPLLAAVDPEVTMPAFRSAGVARQVRDLPPLPATEPELRALGKALAARSSIILTAAAATEAAIRTADLGAGVVAFATHGLVAGELDGLDEPALVVTPSGSDDGLLTASEIMRLKIGADWVILSACNTAAGGATDDSGLAGLARAFLHAGGHNLLVSHWAVRDDAAAALSVATISHYAAGVDPAEALRRAMLTMIRGGTVSGTDQPVNWAPFVFVGR